MKTTKKYYTLYKVIKNPNNHILDIKYLFEVNTYKEIYQFLNISKSDIKKMINNKNCKIENLKVHRNYTIIVE